MDKERDAFESAMFKLADGQTKNEINPVNGQYMYGVMEVMWQVWQAAKAQAVPEGFVVCKSEPVAYIVQNKFWKRKFDVKSVKDMPPQKWEDDHYDVEIPLYAVSLDGLVLKEQDEDEAND